MFFHTLEALQNQLFTDILQINSAPVPVNLRTEEQSFTTWRQIISLYFSHWEDWKYYKDVEWGQEWEGQS